MLNCKLHSISNIQGQLIIYRVQQPVMNMPEKERKTLKASSVTKEKSDAGEEKICTSSKKVDEIDDIFESRKRKKREQEKAERNSDKKEKLKKTKKKKRSIPKDVEAFNPDSKPRRRTNDGLAVYSEEELRINSQDAGSTALCPFDCSCCF